jgi:hypothetical protein
MDHMAAGSPTKAELQETLDQVGESIADMLDPSLTRKQLVEKVKDLDELVNGVDVEDEDEDADGDAQDSDDDESDDDEEDEEE